MKKKWIVRSGKSKANLRLYCFSYAGGNAYNFVSWDDSLHAIAEVCAIQLPGRSTRLDEQPINEIGELIPKLAEVVQDNSKKPFAFFGHSLGALIAYELAVYCARRRLEMPRTLFVSGCAAPHLIPKSSGAVELSDDALLEELRSYAGTPPEILENKELMNIALPSIRADFEMRDKYRYVSSSKLDIPFIILAGSGDGESPENDARGWFEHSSRGSRIEWFDGGHFFINSHRDEVLAYVRNCLQEVVASLDPVSGAKQLDSGNGI